jgi:hypothetical protein
MKFLLFAFTIVLTGMFSPYSLGTTGQTRPMLSDNSGINDKLTLEDIRACASGMGRRWVKVAISKPVGFRIQDVAQIKKDYDTDLGRASAMLILWTVQSDRATYKNLVLALNESDMNDLAIRCMPRFFVVLAN